MSPSGFLKRKITKRSRKFANQIPSFLEEIHFRSDLDVAILTNFIFHLPYNFDDKVLAMYIFLALLTRLLQGRFFFYARITLRRSVAFECTYTQQPTCSDILYIEIGTEGRYIM